MWAEHEATYRGSGEGAVRQSRFRLEPHAVPAATQLLLKSQGRERGEGMGAQSSGTHQGAA